MSKEIIELLEEGLNDAVVNHMIYFKATEYEKELYTVVKQALALLKQQPKALDFAINCGAMGKGDDSCCGCIYWSADGKLLCNECGAEYKLVEKQPKCKTCGDIGRIAKPMPKKPHPCNYVNIKRSEQTIPCPDCPPTAGEFTKDFREQIGRQRWSLGEIRRMAKEACKIIDKSEAEKKDLLEALEKSKEIFSRKMRSLRAKKDKAKSNLHFIESRYLNGVCYQIFELRQEIERMLNKLKLNEFCILSAFMPEEKREAAKAKVKG